jgi:hypothetical protein
MKYNTETPQHIRDEYITRISSRWRQLNELLLSVITDGIKYLFYVNAGGCVAVLTFLGTSDSVRQHTWPWWVLGLFFSGLVLVGFLNLFRYKTIESLQINWQENVGEFYKGDLDFDVITAKDNEKVESSYWIVWFAYLAFACFIGGGLVGLFNFNTLIKGQEMNQQNTSTQQEDQAEKRHIPKQEPIPPAPQPAKK